MVVAFAYAFFEMLGFAPDSRLLPALAIFPGLVFAMIVLIGRLRRLGAAKRPPGIAQYREPFFLLALVVYGILVWAFGFNVATVALLAWMLLDCAKMRPVTGLAYGAVIFAAAHGLLTLMKLDPPVGALLHIL